MGFKVININLQTHTNEFNRIMFLKEKSFRANFSEVIQLQT